MRERKPRGDLFQVRKPDRGLAAERSQSRFLEHWTSRELGGLSDKIANERVIREGMDELTALLDETLEAVRYSGTTKFVADATDHELATALYFSLHEKYAQFMKQLTDDRPRPGRGKV